MIALNTDYNKETDIKEQLALFSARLSSNKGCFAECSNQYQEMLMGLTAVSEFDELQGYYLNVGSITNAIMLNDGSVKLSDIQNAKSLADLYSVIYEGGVE